MISVEEAKERYIIKAEKNGTNDNITTDNYRFCLNFNESQNKFLTLHLQNRGIDDVRYIQKFLIQNEKLLDNTTKADTQNFKLPKNYFDFSSARAIAKKDNCEDFIDLTPEVHSENINEIMYNSDLKPSFEWREAPYLITEDSIAIYTDNFKVKEVLLNYYRYPNQIKLQDNLNPESNFSTDSVIEWDDKALDDIISLMVFNFDINENNPRYQLNTLRIQK